MLAVVAIKKKDRDYNEGVEGVVDDCTTGEDSWE